MKETTKKEKKHLPVFGIGPVYGAIVVLTTVFGILLAQSGALDGGKVESPVWAVIFCVTGAILGISGLLLWFPTFFGSRSIDKCVIKNELCVTGVYSIVRNPCYTGLTFIFIGAIFIARNRWLLWLPLFYWLAMTLILKFTEEKWLLKLYGKKYKEYCASVNRCIPWFPRKKKPEKQKPQLHGENKKGRKKKRK